MSTDPRIGKLSNEDAKLLKQNFGHLLDSAPAWMKEEIERKMSANDPAPTEVQPPKIEPCKNWTKCPHVKSCGSTWDQDFYECTHCGIHFHTNDEDMK